ncbi:glycerol-3-phosphate dehydrogenase/oxidase [Fodinibius sediminis]|uniref:Glycerol-3-phosphate dehydrogenase n=1 Tax=Fodinibius sediminis TaxID=1214077 RepID=A0A521BZH1_9BACT|nr:glycerol-3-phosphate dehydrogenase/oxidase [Fodinibius sediminis]SMO52616.1 glycerol-3-phosphate dehydrogenase [Fodinibius sediminis]
MKRVQMVQRVREEAGLWDIIIVGGGATGLGTAVDAASRGYKTLLLEMDDFAKGTSSRSTKLVHGGVRYLEQGDVPLVLEALKERGRLIQNAPHLVHNQSFIVPYYNWWRGAYYWLGLRIYDILSGKLGFGPSNRLSARTTLEKAATLRTEGLRGSIRYHDGQFDDSRLAVNLARTSAEHGGVPINYMKVTGLLSTSRKVSGVTARDMLSGEEFEIEGRTVINATGVFTDTILQMDRSDSRPVIKASQGVHIVLDKHFLPGETAVMIPKTTDDRILFALPWYGRVMVGTTDTPVNDITDEPEAMEEEIDFILRHASEYLSKKVSRSDIRSVFAGLRPLVKTGGKENTSEISRDHCLMVSSSGLVTIAGGKWTTYRKMAEDVVDRAAVVGGLDDKVCVTKTLRIHGWDKDIAKEDPLSHYGSDRSKIKELVRKNPKLGEPLHDRFPYIKAEVVWATRNEMAMTVEDFSARRIRALFLDAKASVEMAPEVARLMAEEAGHDERWIANQIDDYKKLAKSYQIS